MRKTRKDSNHHRILDVFKRSGCAVIDVSALLGLGFDALALHGDRVRLLEIKSDVVAPSKRKLTDSEAQMFLVHHDVYRIVSTEDEALAVVGELRNQPLAKVVK